MHIKKSIQLTTGPLNTLFRQGQSVDFRLDEAAWADLQLGDCIEFWEDFSGWDKEPRPGSRKALTKIAEIFRATTFSHLIDSLPDSFAERGEKENVIRELRKWWTPERERETGVLAFRVELVS